MVPALLEAGEARDPVPEGDYLPVDDEVLGGIVLVRLGQLGVGGAHVPPRSRHQRHARTVADRDAADAVELLLEYPGGIREALVGEDGLHRLGLARPGGAPEAVAVRLREPLERVVQISSIFLPLRTDSGCVLTGLRRASAFSSFRLISSQRRPSVCWSVQPPWSFSP